MKFKVGDIVKLNNAHFNLIEGSIKAFEPAINIFRIEKVCESSYKLNKLDLNVEANNIEPVPINGIDDKWICIKPDAEVGSVIDRNKPKPLQKKECLVYFRKETPSEINTKIDNEDIKYVHEVQKLLALDDSCIELKIDYLGLIKYSS